MDGVGLGKHDAGDAVFRAKTPNLDLFASNPLAGQLSAHGVAVGMPSDGDMGNSEVGHNCIGAGRIFDQGAKLVVKLSKAVESSKAKHGPQLSNGSSGRTELFTFLDYSPMAMSTAISIIFWPCWNTPLRPAFDAAAFTSCSMDETSKRPARSPTSSNSKRHSSRSIATIRETLLLHPVVAE